MVRILKLLENRAVPRILASLFEEPSDSLHDLRLRVGVTHRDLKPAVSLLERHKLIAVTRIRARAGGRGGFKTKLTPRGEPVAALLTQIEIWLSEK